MATNGAHSDKAYLGIRSRILRCELAPGEKLRVEALQQALGLSSTPVREALNRLATEGLVSFEENRGFKTAPILTSGLRDITRMRVLLEAEALADAITSGDDQWEAGIVAANYRLTQHEKKTSASGSSRGEQWTELHKAFHMALLSACTYPRILHTCSQLFDESERYRRFALRLRILGRNATVEHGDIVSAVLRRDADKALPMLCDHIYRTGESVARVLEDRVAPSVKSS